MTKRIASIAVLVLLAAPAPSWAWWAGGHGILTRAAVRALPEEVPAFFRGGRKMVGHMSFDPDVAKQREMPLVRSAEYGEHYLDLEMLEGRELPRLRQDYIALCFELGVRPERAGYAPYAIAEWTQRLAVAFAEHRKWPENAFIQQKCLVYAGFLAHYAEDLCQPLHVTIHYNGRRQDDGTVLHKGIHEKVDSLPEVLKMDPAGLAEGLEVVAPDSLMPAVFAQLDASFEMVDRVYEMAEDLMAVSDSAEPSAAVVAFANERARESARFTASLMLHAWKASEAVSFERWLDRSRSDR